MNMPTDNHFADRWMLGSVAAFGLLLLVVSALKRRQQSRAAQRDLHARLTKSLQLQNAVLSSTNYSIVATNTDGIVTMFNTTAERWLGYTAAEIVGKVTPALWHDAKVVAARAQALSRELGRPIRPGFETFTAKARLGLVDENEWPFIRKDGTRLLVRLTVTAMHDDAGVVTGFVGVATNITARKEIEAKLEQQQTEMRLLFDYLPALICYKDTQNRILRVNKRVAEPLGKTVAEIEGKTSEEIYPRDAAKYYADDLEVINSGQPKLGIIETFQDQNDQKVWIETDKVPVRDSSGKIVGLIAMCQEITARMQANQELRESEERFKNLSIATFEAICISENGRFLDVNDRFKEQFGYDRAQIIGREIVEIIAPASRLLVAENIRASRDIQYEHQVLHQDGRILTVETRAQMVHMGGRTVRLSAMRDITERKQSERLLRENEERMRLATTTTGVGIWEWNLTTNEVRWDEQMFRMYGLSPTANGMVPYTAWSGAVLPEDLAAQEELMRDTVRRRGQGQREFRIRRASDGVCRHIQAVETVRTNARGDVEWVVGTNLDITERKQAAETIVESLHEKEVLLREIHHRVKNNMQVISSILSLQATYITDPAALEVFNDCQGRIRSMALIHEQLYRSHGLANIDFKDYLESLVGLLIRSQLSRGVKVWTDLQIERVMLDADTAIPLGLIANELVSNCLKHAFTGRAAGRVHIRLAKEDHGGFQLTVQDDGRGLPPGFDPDKINSLGVRLVNILSDQIQGRFFFQNNPGAQFIITFPGNLN